MLFLNEGKRLWTANDVVFAESFQKRIPLSSEFAVAHIPHGDWGDWGKNFYGRKTDELIV